MSIFAISDLHLSLSVDHRMDIFDGWADYDKKIKKNWSETVSENDTVIIPGDVSWGINLDESKEDFKFIENLPGKKIIIKGNHDYWFSTHRRINNFFDEHDIKTIKVLNNDAFEVEDKIICGTRGWSIALSDDTATDKKILRREVIRFKNSVEFAQKNLDVQSKEILAFFHFPPVTIHRAFGEMINILKENEIKRCFYGHLHGDIRDLKFEGKYEDIELKLVAADHLNFKPIKII
ncbi:MAG: metallophosphoesterase [Clostridia bacterium]|nr:metallophosphoesterase [Clostridia bacterium]